MLGVQCGPIGANVSKIRIFENNFQPNLCTYVNRKIITKNKNVILYKSRGNTQGSIVSHIGEVHLGKKAKGLIIDEIK